MCPESHHHLISEYIQKHRPTPAPGSEEYVFLTPQGKQVAHLSDDLRALSKDFPTTQGIIKVTATDMRKMTASDVAEQESEEVLRNVAAHMTHGEETARKYYRHMQGVAQSVSAYELTAQHGSRKRKALEEDDEESDVVVPVHKHKKRKWLPEEDDAIRLHFDLEKETPSLEQCALFLNLHKDDELFSGRTSKELQDKCRTIKRQISKLA